MNILNLLIKEKDTVGVEINDLVIRVAYFRNKKKFIKNNTEKEIVLIEEIIPKNIISNGVIKDKVLLTKTLRNIWSKEKIKDKYAIISIPEDKIYSNLFPFPKAVIGEQLKQAVTLAIDFQLPFKKDEVYVGWENDLDSNNSNEVVISAIPKNITNDYMTVLNNADIDILALESHIASIAHSIKLNKGETTLIIKENSESITLFVLKDNILKFSRTLPAFFLNDREALKNEISKIKNSFENEYKEGVVELPLTEATIRDDYTKYLEANNSIGSASKWLISIGAAIRGEIPKDKDKMISLLPVGTVEAYKYQKIKTFIVLIRNISIGVSIFFLFAFLAIYFYIFSLSQTIKNVSSNVIVSPISKDMAEKEALIQRINSISTVGASILSSTVNWSILIDEINSRVISGITVFSFGATSVSEKVYISGIASNREILNKFKKTLQDSTYLTSVELPITNLEQKGDIPFSVTFMIKDPSMLYYK